MSYCDGTRSSDQCAISCAVGYSPSQKFITCVDGRWTEGACHSRTFSVGPGTFSEVSRDCGLGAGHLATIHSAQENKEVALM
eukprot:TRINITY_DN3652_c0_g1_i1.p2 TRINITY_DN3652_c0_g1~~TRINITY_DN3652_c0_g1_i1.p2  ORF type:complete len:82 (-),score=12.14 TRINITY_DN3652_c0_g1_i1:10-255(-)